MIGLARGFFAVFMGLSAAAASAQQAAQAPIRTRAELDRYLRDTPTEDTPLAPLSPSGRRRFLAGLQFFPHGVGIHFGEPAAELTDPQIVPIFALFGQQAPAGVGLTPAQQRHRRAERAEAARRHGCVPARCPESEIERRFDELDAIRPDFALPDAQRFAASKRDYDRLFAGFQTPERLRSLDAPDLRLLVRALGTVLFVAPDAGHVAQLRNDLQEMQRRGMTEDEDFETLYQAEVTRRQFGEATALHRAHPRMRVATLPTFVSSPEPEPGRPTALGVEARSNTMRRRAVDLGGPLRIVVIAGCHFSEDAARAIEGDAQLRPLFAQHSVWLAAPTQPLEDVAQWNRQFADLPMQVAWHQDEWSMLPVWNMPTYYVFHDGRLAQRFTGWQGVDKLKQSLHASGAL